MTKAKFLQKLKELFPNNSSSVGKGGLIREKSPCCGATVYWTRGGLSTRRCSKCDKAVPERLYR